MHSVDTAPWTELLLQPCSRGAPLCLGIQPPLESGCSLVINQLTDIIVGTGHGRREKGNEPQISC
jgi:hypothetical protein